MKELLEELNRRLAALRREELYRELHPAAGVDFSSNDYLGLSRHPALRQRVLGRLAEEETHAPLASPASRLLRGNTPVHEALEARLARFKGTESALLFPTGYQANVGLLTALIGPRDRALSDEQNHASLIDGLRLARCQKVVVPHLDLGAMEEALATPHPGGRTFLVTESLFSMDGDIAPLDRYADLAHRYGAALMVDDAHATGVFGRERGSGLAEHFGVERRAVAIVSTFGKALGLAGAFVACPRVVAEYLVNRCRSFIFTTAPPPLLLYAIEAAVDLVEEEPWHRERVLALADLLRREFRRHGFPTLASAGPIVPVVLGENRRALAVAEILRERGFDVRAIRPPSVAPGTARLRISVHADHTEEEILGLVEALVEAVTEADVAVAGEART